MGVSAELLDTHIAAWETKLGLSYRRRWPSRLFRHEALENAVEILKQRELLSRADASGQMKRDVAPEEIINLTHAAHRYARLYFRPRTPTQYRIEGIRRLDEIWNGRHAPMLYMFVFKSRLILMRDNVRFSKGNMQIPGMEALTGDNSFSDLVFEKIYHEGRYDPDINGDIKVWRCAEVLCPSPLGLDHSLEAVVCRSDAERKTLLSQLGQEGKYWSPRIRVVSQPGYFNAEYAFVESVDLTSTGVKVRFHPRKMLPVEAHVKLEVQDIGDSINGRIFDNQILDLRTAWNFKFKPKEGEYRVVIHLEGELAYKNILQYEEHPF